MGNLLVLLVTVGIGTAFLSCAGGDAIEPPPVVGIPTITISPANVVLSVGQSQLLTASIKDLDVLATSVRWLVAGDTTVIRHVQTDSFTVTITALRAGNVTLSAVPQPEQGMRGSVAVRVQ